MARASISLMLVLPMVAACRQTTTRATIGYASPYGAPIMFDIVREELAGWPGDWSQRIQLVWDSIPQFDPIDGEVSRAVRLAKLPGIVGVVGPGESRASLAAAPIYNDAKIPQLLPGATSKRLRTAGPYTFMLTADDSVQGVFIGRFAAKHLGARTASVFYWNNEYGAGLRDGLRSGLASGGVRELDAVSFVPGAGYLESITASIRRQPPDVAVIAGYDPATGLEAPSAGIARAIHQLAPQMRLVGSDGLLVSPSLLASRVGAAAESLYVVAFWLPDSDDSVSQTFVTRFRARAGRNPDQFEALSRDALVLLATAVRDVGTNRESIRAYLASLGRDRPPFRGVTGLIRFDNAQTPRLVMARLRGGQATTVLDQ